MLRERRFEKPQEPCIRLACLAYELTNHDSGDGKKFYCSDVNVI